MSVQNVQFWRGQLGPQGVFVVSEVSLPRVFIIHYIYSGSLLWEGDTILGLQVDSVCMHCPHNLQPDSKTQAELDEREAFLNRVSSLFCYTSLALYRVL